MSLQTIKKSDLPPLLSPLGGGWFANVIVLNGENFALICAGKDGQFRVNYSDEDIEIPGAESHIDGMANTLAAAAAGCQWPAVVRAYRGGGFDDWFGPATYQQDTCFRAFKPTTDENYSWLSSANPCLLVPAMPHTKAFPAKTTLAEFQEGGEHAFDTDAYYMSSTARGAYHVVVQDFQDGIQDNGYDRFYHRPLRAVRMIQIVD